MLVDDWDNIVNKKKLINIPAANPIHKIFESYIKELETPSTEVIDAIKGLEVYFNRSIGLFLLYKFERLQYYNFRISKPTAVPSHFYGPEHLLRLLSFIIIIIAFSFFASATS